MTPQQVKRIRALIHNPQLQADLQARIAVRVRVDKFFDSNPDLKEKAVGKVLDRLKRGECTLEDAAAIVRAKKAKANG